MENFFKQVGFIILLISLTISLFPVFTVNSVSDDTIVSNVGGFIITEGMLDKRINEITLPGTHNSFANNKEDRRWPASLYYFSDLSQNHYLKIEEQLDAGIRYIELDINNFLDLVHGTAIAGHAYLDNVLVDIKNWVESHPSQVVIVRVSNLNGGLSANDSYHRINGRLENTGLWEYLYNWDYSKPKDDEGRCFVPSEWPTLGEMIDNNKNVIFLHNDGYGDHDIIDTYYYNWNNSINNGWTAKHMEQLHPSNGIWHSSSQGNELNRFYLIEFCPDTKPAGDRNGALKNNDGRRLYQLADATRSILPSDRDVNIITIDYYYERPVSVVDACNRLNYERFGYDFSITADYWEDTPKGNRVNHAFNKDVYTTGIDNYEVQTYDGVDIERIPANAVDHDLFTRWTAKDQNNHDLYIDLGSTIPINEVAIAWEYGSTGQVPTYDVIVSNDGQNWSTVYSYDRGSTDYNMMDSLVDTWYTCSFNEISTRYVGIRVLNTTDTRWASIFEIEVY